ncbi:hypothetical protein CARUB_v10024951mg [Capsella rubella]|uniref:MATH domain-containing protein n=1 Tax=Capsella rubella TaxID=81985 RepID=R0FZZ8_9BRAS|nr:hypothetical protein CARUB_v10024951mg [Capsella rubella]
MSFLGKRMSSTTVRSLRQRSPSSYSLKIQNFSQLENSTLYSDGKYQSRIFSSGGYNWRMILYPKGNNEDNGSDFISMYVKLDSTSLSSKPSTDEVFADFCIFKDPENGYVNQDQCEFGVDVIVAPPPTNWEIISFNNNLHYPKFSWNDQNFSEMKDYRHKSPRFTIEGRQWVIDLYPKAILTRDESKWISIFLSLDESETIEEDEQIFKQAVIRILDPRGLIACKDSSSWGYARFVSMDDLRKTYLDMDGALNIEVEFGVVSTT